MTQHGVLDYEVKAAVAAKGYFPEDMPIEDYPDGFIKGVLIGAWGAGLRMDRKEPGAPAVLTSHCRGSAGAGISPYLSNLKRSLRK